MATCAYQKSDLTSTKKNVTSISTTTCSLARRNISFFSFAQVSQTTN